MIPQYFTSRHPNSHFSGLTVNFASFILSQTFFIYSRCCSEFKEFEIFLWEKRRLRQCQDSNSGLRLPVDCSNQLNYTGDSHILLHRKTSLHRLTALPYDCNDFKLGGRVRNFCHCLHYRRIISCVTDRILFATTITSSR